MAKAIHTPRVNNNDDVVKLSHLYVEQGAKIRAGDPLAEVETDKATFTVESEADGYVLAVNGALGETIAVGSVLVWLGDTADERVEDGPARTAGSRAGGALNGSTLKARLRVKQAEEARRAAPVTLPGREEALSPEQRGMLRTVSWQREHAAPGYLEIEYDPAPWQQFADEFKAAHGLWFDPAVSLMAWRLARIAGEQPRINATVAGTSAHLYEDVNLGFTIQADATLYLAVVKGAQQMDALGFVRALGALQLGAMRHSLSAEQTSDATVTFSSMARWGVTRHVPVLPPNTAMIAAHTAAAGGRAQLGATYDHRLLTGFDVVKALQALAKPPSRS
jgi:pyruvate/2-oxoglutarate dehydrogenase complex dihydrolipoamide acyltransferase (E2) component